MPAAHDPQCRPAATARIQPVTERKPADRIHGAGNDRCRSPGPPLFVYRVGSAASPECAELGPVDRRYQVRSGTATALVRPDPGVCRTQRQGRQSNLPQVLQLSRGAGPEPLSQLESENPARCSSEPAFLVDFLKSESAFFACLSEVPNPRSMRMRDPYYREDLKVERQRIDIVNPQVL